MRYNFKGKDFLAIKDLTRKEILFSVKSSLDFKRKRDNDESHEYLKEQIWDGLFEKNSTRTWNVLNQSHSCFVCQ